MAERSTRKPESPLPRFIAPMLAQPGAPFDSEECLFEVKWDGTRTLAFIEEKSYRLVNRRRIDMTDRYPEFGFLARLPSGTVLDGEMIVLREGKPDFSRLQAREQVRSPLKIRSQARVMPATYIVFDILYEASLPVMAQPFRARRARLAAVVKECNSPQLLLSEGVVGKGKAFFEGTCRQGLEGVVAKRLTSHYLAGKRTDAWIKIKRSDATVCAIIGFVASGKDDFRSLILAAELDGVLRCVGKVGTGIDAKMRARLNAALWKRVRDKPLVPCKIKGTWVAPALYCKVSYMERTAGGEFRAPVFQELYEG